MGAPEVLAQIAAAGVTVKLEGDRVIAGPVPIPPSIRELIRANKPEIVRALMLEPHPAPNTHSTAHYPPGILSANAITGADPVQATSGSAGGRERSLSPPDSAMRARKQKVIAMLAESPEMRRAIYYDANGDADYGIVVIADRGLHSFEVHVPKSRMDAFAFLDVLRKYGGA